MVGSIEGLCDALVTADMIILAWEFLPSEETASNNNMSEYLKQIKTMKEKYHRSRKTFGSHQISFQIGRYELATGGPSRFQGKRTNASRIQSTQFRK
ncbi:hypothetical protein PoB_002049000 [Plakobranchus ocellatus]|uniref:Uncharacterized protein n=1 Tax=Plakobranchus ocellatus TaxID=259542 RepID=A0AAV3ZHD3_9GAST|nr:hypothetical protein PoB_002049000 [Plakobranchus ocellatus]